MLPGLMSRWMTPRRCASLQRRADLLHDPHLLLEALAIVHSVERLTLDVLHRDERLAVGLPGLVDTANALVLHARLGLGLLEHAPCVFRIGDAQQLERDGAPEEAIAPAIDGAHAPVTEEEDVLITVAKRGRQRARRVQRPVRRRLRRLERPFRSAFAGA
jgi:hypothetical protein